VQISISALQLTRTGADGHRRAEPGAYEISAGGKQPGFRGLADAATTSVVTGALQITGPAMEIR
jgi:beta-glucosidase